MSKITFGTATTLSALLLASSSLSLISQAPSLAASQKAGSKAEVEVKTAKKDSAEHYLDDATMKLINAGDFNVVASHIEKLLAQDKKTGKSSSAQALKRSYLEGWLAFAYMYNARAKENKELAARVGLTDIAAAKSDSELKIAANNRIVRAFDEVAAARFDEAENMLNQIPRDIKAALVEDDCLYNFAQACVAFKKGQAAKACDYSAKATKADSRFAWGYRTIAVLRLRKLKDNAAAEAALEKALALYPTQSDSRDMLVDIKLAKNDFDGAIDVAKEGIKDSPKSAASHFRLASIYTQQWRLREALAELNKAITLDPYSAKYFRSRATVERLEGELVKAIYDQGRAVELGKDKAFELMELANLNLLAGNKNKAIDSLNNALTVDSENQQARERLCKLLTEEKRYDDLAKQYRELISAHPKNAALHLGLANVLLLLKEDDKAIEEFKEAANLSQSDPTAHRSLGAYYISKHQFAKAAKEYTRALNKVPTSVKDLAALGYCYAENDDYMQAEAAYVTAMALQQLAPSPDDPSRVDVMRSLSCLLYEEGRYADAASQFENLVVGFKDKGATAEDAFLLAKSKLLRDLTDSAAKNMLAVYEVLPAASKESFRAELIQALLDSSMPALAREQLAKVTDSEKAANPLYALFSAAAARQCGDKNALSLLNSALPALEAKKEESPALLALAYCEKAKIELAEGKLEDALASAKLAQQTYDKCYEALYLESQITLKKGDGNAAYDLARRALEINPYYASAYVVMGESQIKNGATKDGIENLRKAIELYPGWLDAHRALLGGYKKAQLKDEAKKEEALIVSMEDKAKAP